MAPLLVTRKLDAGRIIGIRLGSFIVSLYRALQMLCDAFSDKFTLPQKFVMSSSCVTYFRATGVSLREA